jgi:hypothetical protein
VTLLNCTAINTRAGFEIGAPDNAPKKTLLENCVARGCERAIPALPIMLGFGMPQHAEMSSPIEPAPTRGVTLINEIAAAQVITGNVTDCKVETIGRSATDEEMRKLPSRARGAWPGARPSAPGTPAPGTSAPKDATPAASPR